MRGSDALVVGGGLHGLSAALHLARRGCVVRVLEARRIAAQASGFSAGGVRTLGRDLAEVPLALEALERWHRIADLVDDDCGFRCVGQVRVAENQDELGALRDRVARMDAFGWTHERVVGADEVRGLLPAIAPHVVGGIAADRDGFAQPLRATLAFGRSARRAGADIVEGADVVAADGSSGRWVLRTTDGEAYAAPIVVNAAGAWGGRIARTVGDRILLGFNAFQMLMTDSLPPFVAPVVGAAGRPLSFKQGASGHVMIGGGHKGSADLDTSRVTLDVPRLAYSARTALELFPILRDARIVHAWAGIEGVTPDHLPVVGRSTTVEGVVHAFGFSGHGFALAPLIGEIVARLLLDGHADRPLAAFAPNRFVRGEGASEPRSALSQPAG